MKSSQSFFNEYQRYIIPSDIIEFTYCHRFIYFMKVLGISQYEEKRFKVQLGRDIHQRKSEQNKDYLRKKIGSCNKEIDVWLVSGKLGIRGKVDEVHTLEDGTMSPLDYKFAVYEEKIYKTYKYQLVLYALMIEEVYGKIVNKGFLVYCRNENKLVEVEITDEDKKEALSEVEEHKKVLNGFFPKATKDKMKCLDCCYRNVCIK